ncbi:hypothetical protein DESC_290183 [Desulfosarcina cetonica]|nr:hypothetical protein DESC_290183 [Desulfosarcina cetonica]
MVHQRGTLEQGAAICDSDTGGHQMPIRSPSYLLSTPRRGCYYFRVEKDSEDYRGLSRQLLMVVPISIDPQKRVKGYSCRCNPLFFIWSGQQDLNLRPQRPERCALPD